jgi:sulfate permease, SulP family
MGAGMSLTELIKSSSRRQHSFPFLTWLPMVTRKTVTADAWAGITGAIVVLPQGAALAMIAGMPPEYGLYAAMTPTIVAALFGSSWHLMAGPSMTASLVLFSSLSQLAEPGSAHYVHLAITLAFMVGLMELGLGAFKLGAVVNFISHSVIVGFTAGVGLLIISSQAKNFFGGNFLEGNFHWPTAAVGAVTLATSIGVRRCLPRVPFMIVAILAGSAAAAAFNHWGYGVPTMAAMPSRLPPLSLPSFDPAVWSILLPTALALTVSALNEAVSISRALAIRSGQHVDASREFIGQGMANAIGSFFSGYVVSSSFNRSALNYAAGARTPLSALIAGTLLMAFIPLAAPLAAYLPYSAMAASLILIGWGLIDRDAILRVARTSRSEIAILAATLLATLLIQVQMAILAGVVLSLVVYLYRTSNPRISLRVPDPASPLRKFADPRPDLPECPQFRIIRLNGSLFFGAVNAFKDTLIGYERSDPQAKHLAIVMTGVNFIDVAGAEALAQMAKRYRARGGGLYLIRPNRRVIDLLERGGYLNDIGADRIFASKTQALRQIYRRLDYTLCKACERRVFIECPREGRPEPVEKEDAPPLQHHANSCH